MKCVVCGKNVEKVAVALCKKLIDRNTRRMMCLSCLSNYLETEEDELLQKADEFKKEGCTLFK